MPRRDSRAGDSCADGRHCGPSRPPGAVAARLALATTLGLVVVVLLVASGAAIAAAAPPAAAAVAPDALATAAGHATPWVATSDGGSPRWAAAAAAATDGGAWSAGTRREPPGAADGDESAGGTGASDGPGPDDGAAASVSGAGPDDEVRLVAGNASLRAGANGTLRISLARVPSGLSGFEATVELSASADSTGGESGPVARIANASYPGRFAPTTRPAIDADGQSVTVEAADLRDDVRPGDENVTLATVVLRGEAAGETTATIVDASVVADGGAAEAVAPVAGTVSVVGTEASGSTSGAGSRGPAWSDASAVADTRGQNADSAPESTDGDAESLSLVHLGLLTALVLGSALLAVATSLRGD